MNMRQTFHKSERLCSQRIIDDLFAGDALSSACFPLRIVHKPLPSHDKTQILVSVGKRRLRHAIDRNRAKRQMREAYRLNKHLLTAQPHAIAFVWLSSTPVPTSRVFYAMKKLLRTITPTEQ